MLDWFEELENIQLQEILMNMILTKMEQEGKIVFYESESDSLH